MPEGEPLGDQQLGLVALMLNSGAALLAFLALAFFVSAKRQRQSFKAGGKAIEVSLIGSVTARHARNRYVSHDAFPPRYSAQRRNTRIKGESKACQRIIEGEMSARFDRPRKTTWPATLRRESVRRNRATGKLMENLMRLSFIAIGARQRGSGKKQIIRAHHRQWRSDQEPITGTCRVACRPGGQASAGRSEGFCVYKISHDCWRNAVEWKAVPINYTPLLYRSGA